MATQVCSAMKFLESKKIVHKDVVCVSIATLNVLANTETPLKAKPFFNLLGYT